MSDLSNYSKDRLVNHLLGVQAFTMPTTVYIAAFTAVTNAEAGTGTEVSGAGYTRVAVTFSQSTGGAGATSNPGIVAFPTATANYPAQVTHAGIFDAPSGGNCLLKLKALTTPRTVLSGQTLRFPVGDIDVALT